MVKRISLPSFFNDTATTEIYTLSLHDALPICNVLHAKVISGIEEVKARGAYIIAVAEENDPDVERYADVVFWRPACPTLMSPLVDVVPLQLFAMDMAKLKNYDVDKPRNLAKSVTVE